MSTVASRDACVVLGNSMQRLDLGGGISLIILVALAKDTSMKMAMHYLNLPQKNDLVLTNTLFSHKLCHRTTWTAPERYHTSAKDDQGNPQLLLGPDNLLRREPFRNQIDYIYIATKIKHRQFVTNSRSYSPYARIFQREAATVL